MLNIIPIPAFQDNYIWCIHNRQNAIIIDPGEASVVTDYLTSQNLQLEAILITHKHPDHIGGVNTLQKTFAVPVYGPHAEAQEVITNPCHADEKLYFESLNCQFTVLEIPGHTLGHIAFHNDMSVFCGDTLFSAGCGRLFEGTAQQMYHSLQQLAALPASCQVYCAHEYTLNNLKFALHVEPDNLFSQAYNQQILTTRAQYQPSLPSSIETELKINPFLRCQQASIINSVQKYSGKNLDNPIEVFKYLRKWKDHF